MGLKKCPLWKLGWFVILCINFVFGVSGVIICTLKLKYVDSDEVRVNFFKLSMAFAACNLLVSALLLVSVLKNKHKCAFLYACLSFLSLFAATLHIEGHTTRNATFLITFSVFGVLCLSWFCIYGAYQVLIKEQAEEMEECEPSPI